MNEFPTHPDIRLNSIAWVETIFNYAVLKGDALFTAITIGIRSVLDFLELLFVKTPWIVIITTIVTLTGLSAGPRAAIYSAGFLAYMGFLGFWVKAMREMWYFEISFQGIEFKENYMPKKYAVAILPLAGFLTTIGAVISFVKKV